MVAFDGFTSDDILSLPDEVLRRSVASGEVMVVRVGTADVLGRSWIERDALVLELGHIDGGGEGVLPATAALARHVARRQGLSSIEWRVHAVNCARPNLKLRRLLERRGFEVVDRPDVGVCYWKLQAV